MTDLKVFTATVAYDDFPEGGTWYGVVMAPDEETADRLFGQQILIDNDWHLEGEGQKSFLDYFNSLDQINKWEGLNGNACPSCQSHDTKVVAGELGSWSSPARGCNSCGYKWLPLGYEPTLQKSAAQAWQTRIDGLDEAEAASLEGSDDE